MTANLLPFTADPNDKKGLSGGSPKVFNFRGTDVRTVIYRGDPWWVLKDVCDALDIKNPGDAANRLDDDEKAILPIGSTDVNVGVRDMHVINESGLYSVIITSRKPQAKAFKRWVTHEVLPQIMHTGTYFPKGEDLTLALGNPNFVKALLEQVNVLCDEYNRVHAQQAALTTTIEEQSAQLAIQTQQIAELQPRADYCESVLQSTRAITITAIASDYGMSAKHMNNILHELQIQHKINGTWILNRQYISEGYTQTKTHAYTRNDGSVGTNTHTYWTQKGRLFLYDILKQNGYIPVCEREDVNP